MVLKLNCSNLKKTLEEGKLDFMQEIFSEKLYKDCSACFHDVSGKSEGQTPRVSFH